MACETLVKILGDKFHTLLILESRNRFVLGIHLNSLRAFYHTEARRPLCFAYQSPLRRCMGAAYPAWSDYQHLIECFNKQFKAWQKFSFSLLLLLTTSFPRPSSSTTSSASPPRLERPHLGSVRPPIMLSKTYRYIAKFTDFGFYFFMFIHSAVFLFT